MARTSKKAKVVTVATADEVANSVAEIVGALPAPEAEAVAAAETGSTPETVANGEIAFIPLNKLKKSPRNARKTPHSEADIEAYAASIAAKGILQNLVVEPELDANGEPIGFYFVTIGEGRRLAGCSDCVTSAWAVQNSATSCSARLRMYAANLACRSNATSISGSNTASAPMPSSRAAPG